MAVFKIIGVAMIAGYILSSYLMNVIYSKILTG
jgi:hypothetical protein